MKMTKNTKWFGLAGGVVALSLILLTIGYAYQLDLKFITEYVDGGKVTGTHQQYQEYDWAITLAKNDARRKANVKCEALGSCDVSTIAYTSTECEERENPSIFPTGHNYRCTVEGDVTCVCRVEESEEEEEE